MNSYIKNKRKTEKVVSILSICFWIINFVFLEISLNMFLKIISAGTSSWFDSAAKQEVSNDPFFIQRTDLIMTSMIVVLLVIIAFSAVTVVLIRNMQLKNMYTQMGVYVVVGYSKKRIYNICIMEPFADIIIAFPVSILLSAIVWKQLSKVDTIHSLLLLIGDSGWWDVLAYVIAALFIILVVLVHARIFINKSIKNGIRFMLGKGVV